MSYCITLVNNTITTCVTNNGTTCENNITTSVTKDDITCVGNNITTSVTNNDTPCVKEQCYHFINSSVSTHVNTGVTKVNGNESFIYHLLW